MKIFNKTEPHEFKVNFVDENNVMLGYDLMQDCCEDANWFIADKPQLETPENDLVKDHFEEGMVIEMPGWVFYKSYFQEIAGGDELDAGKMVTFQIKKGIYPDKEVKYIHLYNVHNGYYGHGFEFKGKAESYQDREGCL